MKFVLFLSATKLSNLEGFSITCWSKETGQLFWFWFYFGLRLAKKSWFWFYDAQLHIICCRNFLQFIRRRAVFSRHGRCLLRCRFWPCSQLIHPSVRIGLGCTKRQETRSGGALIYCLLTYICCMK